MGIIVNCTHKDTPLDLPVTPPAVNENELISNLTTTPPTIDGVIDAVWDNASKTDVTPQVPDPGNALFVGYIGEKYPLTLRSLYDASYIYFLAEIPDVGNSVQVSPFYFNPTTHRWAQEPSSRSYDVNGVMTRQGWGEDKLAMLWNIDNSTRDFGTKTCYASCHVFTPYLDPTDTMRSNQSGNHYTNGANEKIDMWWLKVGRDPIYGQFSDEYQDWAGGPSITQRVGGSGNGRHQDDQVVTGNSTSWPFAPTYSSNISTTGTSNNYQDMQITGTTGAANKYRVPKYVIPGRTNYYYVLRSEVTDATAKLVTAVDSFGVLTLDDLSTIDPNVGTDYQRLSSSPTSLDGPKIIPSYVSEGPLTNGRADISCQAAYTGSKWVIEWKRLLKTPDVLKQDIDFSSLDDQPFGVAYFNQSNNQHAIKPNLLLKFKK
jgi:hypothetical protein